MTMDELVVTTHAQHRIRKRFGINRRSVRRFVETVIRDGKIEPNHAPGRVSVKHGAAVLIMSDTTVLTCINDDELVGDAKS